MVRALILALVIVAGCGDSTNVDCLYPYSVMPISPHPTAERFLDGPTVGTNGMAWVWYDLTETGTCEEVNEIWEWIDCNQGWEYITQVRVAVACEVGG